MPALSLVVFLQRRKLDAVYYYMRSLAASNPILTAKESLMSLFEETKRKVSLGAGLWDAAAALADLQLETCNLWRRLMEVAFGLGVSTCILVINSVLVVGRKRKPSK